MPTTFHNNLYLFFLWLTFYSYFTYIAILSYLNNSTCSLSFSRLCPSLLNFFLYNHFHFCFFLFLFKDQHSDLYIIAGLNNFVELLFYFKWNSFGIQHRHFIQPNLIILVTSSILLHN